MAQLSQRGGGCPVAPWGYVPRAATDARASDEAGAGAAGSAGATPLSTASNP